MTCDHKRGWDRNTAITVCRNCRDYICSICNVTIAWHDKLYVTNPPVQWRYCSKDACLQVEAAYHGLPLAEMAQRREELRTKRMLEQQASAAAQRVAWVPTQAARPAVGLAAFRPERIQIEPQAFMLAPGEACWCNLGKDCKGSHEIFLGEPVHVCGTCGEEFEISNTDPHWASGRGPICPKRTAL